MFKKILIANRGEIACRIIKSTALMGIASVAVYSDADKAALHVRLADEAVRIGPAPAAQSYLDINNIIKACQKTGAEAVHPGYGFLSENPEFARALAKAGIAFIGPNIRAIEVMGDKIASKKFAQQANVSTVPGHLGVIKDTKAALKIAGEVGYPVMMKASAGGGGKGMRIAYSPKEVEEGFVAAMSEARSSFGDDRVFIEKFIENPRHIEIQVLGDKHGQVIHLGERECSIQRRNQKVIEEAPSAFLTAKTRKAMGDEAVALATAVDYESAGTVEFIVDDKQNFYFLEMNTRLQVEHPVTELVTGIDLVEQMIKIAAGDRLQFAQSDVKTNGWAIESRIYAEDPARNFLPSIGRLVRYSPPAETSVKGNTIRNDTGVYEGDEITVHYDPMIAKLCTHAKDRSSAIDLMCSALDEFVIDGVKPNIGFLSHLMAHKRWRAGNISTGFIAQEYPDGFDPAMPDEQALMRFASVAIQIDNIVNERKRAISQQMSGRNVRFSTRRVVRLVVHLGEGDHVQQFNGEITPENAHLARIVYFDGAEANITGNPAFECVVDSDWTPGDILWRGRIDGRQLVVQVRPILNGVSLSSGGHVVTARVYTQREAELAALMPVKLAPDTSGLLLCPMPGLLVSLAVTPGQDVKAGEQLCIVEAMKMENILRAERDGVVKAIEYEPGAVLAVDDVIMTFDQ